MAPLTSLSLAASYAEADRVALDAIAASRPMLRALVRARDAIQWPDRTLLHAGPPLGGDVPPAPILHSAAHAAVYEGWTPTFDAAIDAIRAHEILLAPAQEHNCVVPLAAVLSPGQYVQVVSDAAGRGRTIHAALSGGSGPAIRLGIDNPRVVTHLHWVNGPLAETIGARLGAPIDLAAIADAALALGDDCHGRTIEGTRLVVEHLAAQCAFDDDTIQRFLDTSPGFFLNAWMAASRCMLSAAENVNGSAIVTSMGANGRRAGIRLAHAPARWFTIAASTPVGRFDSGLSAADGLPAVGDSAVVEALGLGAMCMHRSDAQQQSLGAFMPAPPALLNDTLLGVAHPAFTHGTTLLGLNARRVVASRLQPAVALGVLDSNGRRGRIGGGIWSAPQDLFDEALTALFN
ncbi:DUF1116 domain-containing protein [Paraburkholderia sp.]|uniref:oxamate carbamoyltransferase subunit AllG family protein n=1 Tax=Paraburkholderia sp. TaxID=1926495 RepID=UPI0039E426FC